MPEKEIVEELEIRYAQIEKLNIKIEKLYELLSLMNPNNLVRPK